MIVLMMGRLVPLSNLLIWGLLLSRVPGISLDSFVSNVWLSAISTLVVQGGSYLLLCLIALDIGTRVPSVLDPECPALSGFFPNLPSSYWLCKGELYSFHVF